MIHIDAEACKSCGICGIVCPRHVLQTVENDGEKATVVVPERLDVCMDCGHCAAVCPNGAIRVDGLDPAGFKPVPPPAVGYDDLLALMERRRSVRRYKDKPVPRDLLDRVVEAVRLAPTGTGRPTNGVILIDRREKIEALSEQIYQLYEGMDKALGNPVGRFIVRRRAGKDKLKVLQDFVMPGFRWYSQWYRDGLGDEITRDCPVLMLFHCPAGEPQGDENCVIAAIHALYAAETLGLGACFNSLIPQACNRSADLKTMLGLPGDRAVHTSVTLGYPKYKFARTIPRDLAEVRYL